MQRNIVKTASLFIVLSMLWLTGCTGKSSVSSDANGKLSVYTSFYILYDFANKIGGDRIQITNLVPAGTEPHDWEPSPRDMAALEKADLLIYNGAGMEGWMEKVTTSIRNKNLILVEASKGVALLEGEHGQEEAHTDENESDEHVDGHGHDELQYDPHVWLNPMLAKKQMENIKNAFVSADPQQKDFYESNYDNYARKLDELDKEFKDAVAGFKQKDMIVAHQAFGYLCQAYGLSQVAIEGLNAESEPTPAKMADIVKFAKENRVTTIYFEELVSPKVAEVIAREAGAKTRMLNPLEGLKDEDIKAGKDYFSVMRDNLEALREGLS